MHWSFFLGKTDDKGKRQRKNGVKALTIPEEACQVLFVLMLGTYSLTCFCDHLYKALTSIMWP